MICIIPDKAIKRHILTFQGDISTFFWAFSFPVLFKCKYTGFKTILYIWFDFGILISYYNIFFIIKKAMGGMHGQCKKLLLAISLFVLPTFVEQKNYICLMQYLLQALIYFWIEPVVYNHSQTAVNTYSDFFWNWNSRASNKTV